MAVGKDQFLAAIKKVYDLRIARKDDELFRHISPAAQYRLVGDASLMRGLKTDLGLATQTAQPLIDAFDYHEFKWLNVIVEGDKAVIHGRLTFSRRGSDERVDTELCDLWTMGPDGMLSEMLQFGDTARIAQMMSA